MRSTPLEALARAHLACLPGGDVDEALRAFERLSTEFDRIRGRSREVCLILWNATGDQEHLRQAKRLLDAALAKVPDEYHEAMRRNIRVHREILTACREQFGYELPDWVESDTA